MTERKKDKRQTVVEENTTQKNMSTKDITSVLSIRKKPFHFLRTFYCESRVIFTTFGVAIVTVTLKIACHF